MEVMVRQSLLFYIDKVFIVMRQIFHHDGTFVSSR